jgi:hypothetical protein
MGYSYDYLVAALRCPVTGKVTPADYTTGMTTYLPTEPAMAELGVGDRLEIDPARANAGDYNGYLLVNPVVPGAPVRICQTWECPYCAVFIHWAEIRVEDGTIAAIETVPIDRETLARVNLISVDVVSVVADLTGEPIETLPGTDLVGRLRALLQAR